MEKEVRKNLNEYKNHNRKAVCCECRGIWRKRFWNVLLRAKSVSSEGISFFPEAKQLFPSKLSAVLLP